MCLAFLSYHRALAPEVVLLVNRDEHYARPTAPLHLWSAPTPLYAGKDLVAGGTWVGAHPRGRFGLLTNHRPLAFRPRPGTQSRGQIILDYLSATCSPTAFLNSLHVQSRQYAPFSLILFDPQEGLFYYNSLQRNSLQLGYGIVGLSNAYLNTPWPKLRDGKRAFARELAAPQGDENTQNKALFDLMRNEQRPPDEDLPSSHLPLAIERAYASRYIRTPTYGTRSTTLLRLRADGSACICEQSYVGTSTTKDPALYVRHDFFWSKKKKPMH